MVQCILPSSPRRQGRVRDRSPGGAPPSRRPGRRGGARKARRPESVGRGAQGAGLSAKAGPRRGGARPRGRSPGWGGERGEGRLRERGGGGSRGPAPRAAAARGGDRRDATPRRWRGGGRGRGDARPRERRASADRAGVAMPVGRGRGARSTGEQRGEATERRTTRREGRHQFGQNRRDRSPACVTDTLGTRRRSTATPIGGGAALESCRFAFPPGRASPPHLSETRGALFRGWLTHVSQPAALLGRARRQP